MFLKSRKIVLLAVCLSAFCTTFVKATHNRAGEITYSQDTGNPLLYHFTIITYTKTSSPADRPALEIFWGDGSKDSVPRLSKVPVGTDISLNTYKWDHQYGGAGTYIIYFEDPNRNGGVINIPGSVNIPFYVETRLTISPFLGYNNSPVLFQPPIDDGLVNVPFVHNPNAYDPDGDSLAYELTPCKGTGGQNIPGYTYPNASNSFTLDPITGDLVWDSPLQCGEFNVAFYIKEYRNGSLIGFVERDMQITIFCGGGNQPPAFNALNDICVDAGTLINFPVSATDPNNNNITLSATGAPFQFSPNGASFPEVTGSGTVTGTFSWQTACEHIRKAPYQIVFKAKDNSVIANLATLKRVNITVVGPSPKNPSATPLGNTMILNWDQSACSQAVGYEIYRRNGFYGFIPGPCETGVPAYTGYVKIGNVNGLTNTTFTDNNNGSGLVRGIDYCYMIVAVYPDGARSYASVEVCAQLKKDLPVITNVSVAVTDLVNGQMDIAWSKPSELDTLQFPGPYEYRIYRSQGFSAFGFQLIGTLTSLNDTDFTDTGINTVLYPYTYKIELYNQSNGLLGSTQNASSIFLSITPTDRKLLLSWQELVPWTNYQYVIYRQNGTQWDSIGFSTSAAFADTGLVNGVSYCYYVQSRGDYSASGFVSPILNLSQQTCSTPVDNLPPCNVTDFDSLLYNCFDGEIKFGWTPPDLSCAADFSHYSIYYAPDENSPFSIIAIINNLSQSEFTWNSPDSVAGCYYITTSDTNHNESSPGPLFCFDYCPVYQIPNIFTPDNNGYNDILHPFPYRYVRDIDLVIFNRWGQQVFSTADPDINWNGRLNNSGKDCPDGVYYYLCTVNERYRNGIRQRILKPGFIHILRGSDSGQGN